jgi:hypothetical protein
MANIPKVWNGTAFIELEAAATVGPAASTTVVGIVQLTDSTSSTSTTTAATPNSVKSAFDLAGTAIPKNTVTTAGDILYASGSATVARLGIGTASQVLGIAAGVPAWTTPAGGGGYLVDIAGTVAGTALGLTSAAYLVTNVTDFSSQISVQGVVQTFSATPSIRITATSEIDSIGIASNTYTTRTSGFVSTDSIHTVKYLNNAYFIGGAGGTARSSTDGITWSAVTIGFSTRAVNSFAYGAATYIAVGEQTLTSSTDGITWTSRSHGYGTDEIRGAAFGAGLFVIVGDGGLIQTSPDGITWTSRTSQFSTTMITDVAYANNLFVAVGQTGKVSTSTDGVTWVSRTSSFSTTNINAVAYGNGTWVIVGASNKVATSSDGTTWTQRTAQTITSFFEGVAWDGTKFTICASAGEIQTSPTGVTWTNQTSGTARRLRKVAYAKGLIVVVGGDGGVNNILRTSPGGALSTLFTPITYSTKP